MLWPWPSSFWPPKLISSSMFQDALATNRIKSIPEISRKKWKWYFLHIWSCSDPDIWPFDPKTKPVHLCHTMFAESLLKIQQWIPQISHKQHPRRMDTQTHVRTHGHIDGRHENITLPAPTRPIHEMRQWHNTKKASSFSEYNKFKYCTVLFIIQVFRAFHGWFSKKEIHTARRKSWSNNFQKFAFGKPSLTWNTSEKNWPDKPKLKVALWMWITYIGKSKHPRSAVNCFFQFPLQILVQIKHKRTEMFRQQVRYPCEQCLECPRLPDQATGISWHQHSTTNSVHSHNRPAGRDSLKKSIKSLNQRETDKARYFHRQD